MVNIKKNPDEWPEGEDLIPAAHEKGYIEAAAALFPDGYTKAEATAVLKLVSGGRDVHEDYVRGLHRIGHVRTKKITDRMSLYNRLDVNTYEVEEPGAKAGRIAKEQAAERKKIGQKRKRSPNKKKTQA